MKITLKSSNLFRHKKTPRFLRGFFDILLSRKQEIVGEEPIHVWPCKIEPLSNNCLTSTSLLRFVNERSYNYITIFAKCQTSFLVFLFLSVSV